ncbi:hypothetical protein PQR75_01110 [Paraburkholderia fungorum]|uniref:hypothetical protein n=1 Tax=Paraburkholderia fungorum TaxID=134537 RepID=UPI0038BD775C
MRKATSAGGRLWDEASFFDLLRQRDAKAEPYARKLLDWVSTRGSVWWGRGAQTGSFVPMIRSSSKPKALCAMYTGGTLEMYFRFLASKPPFDDAQQLNDAIARVSRALPKPLIEDAAHKKPNIRLCELSALQFDQLLDALDWMAQAIHNS